MIQVIKYRFLLWTFSLRILCSSLCSQLSYILKLHISISTSDTDLKFSVDSYFLVERNDLCVRYIFHEQVNGFMPIAVYHQRRYFMIIFMCSSYAFSPPSFLFDSIGSRAFSIWTRTIGVTVFMISLLMKFQSFNNYLPRTYYLYLIIDMLEKTKLQYKYYNIIDVYYLSLWKQRHY